MSYKNEEKVISQKTKDKIRRIHNEQYVIHYKFKFGKYKGELLTDVYESNPNYLTWLYNNSEKLDLVLTNFIKEKKLS